MAESHSGVVELAIELEDPSDCPDEERVARVVQTVLSGEQVTWDQVNVVLTGHEAVLELNKTWLEHDWHTDVLSFLLESDPIEGEVYVDVETARERCAEFGSTSTQEIERYIIHGLLHLCGHDDATDAERDAMRQREDAYLIELG